MMVGREVGLFPKEEAQIGEPILEVRNLSGKNGVKDVSFTVRKGEIVGLAGLVGAGRTEVARLICGVDRGHGGSLASTGSRSIFTTPAMRSTRASAGCRRIANNTAWCWAWTSSRTSRLAILKRISGVTGHITPAKRT